MQSVQHGRQEATCAKQLVPELPNLTRAESQCHLYLSVRVTYCLEALSLGVSVD